MVWKKTMIRVALFARGSAFNQIVLQAIHPIRLIQACKKLSSGRSKLCGTISRFGLTHRLSQWTGYQGYQELRRQDNIARAVSN